MLVWRFWVLLHPLALTYSSRFQSVESDGKGREARRGREERGGEGRKRRTVPLPELPPPDQRFRCALANHRARDKDQTNEEDDDGGDDEPGDEEEPCWYFLLLDVRERDGQVEE